MKLDMTEVSKLNKAQMRFVDKQLSRAYTKELITDSINGAVQFMGNPMVALVAGVTTLEYLRRKEMLTFFTAGILEAAILGSTMTNAVAKSGIINQLYKAGEENTSKAASTARDLLPLLLTAGGAV